MDTPTVAKRARVAQRRRLLPCSRAWPALQHSCGRDVDVAGGRGAAQAGSQGEVQHDDKQSSARAVVRLKSAHASSEIEASSDGGSRSFEDVGQEGCWASTFAYKN